VGIATYVYHAPPKEMLILGVGGLLAIHNLLANFRHSQIWIPFPRWLSFVFSSPAMHQIHHSAEERHWDKNYAIVISLWDWMLGTLYIPRERERFALGVHGEPRGEHDSVLKLYVRPLVRAGRVLARGVPGAARSRGVEPNQQGPA
jgi:sterol desaturase/sphingolipid hydroxylase (fatty acid hydroxylase superfamily)